MYCIDVIVLHYVSLSDTLYVLEINNTSMKIIKDNYTGLMYGVASINGIRFWATDYTTIGVIDKLIKLYEAKK